MSFSKDFSWGVSSAAYQTEGAAYEDGKGLSIWDAYCKQPGKIWSGQSGDVACDHYHLYKEDIDLMKELGVKNFRFSLSWPRLIPNGTGAVNPKGLDFYNRLVDEMVAAGVTPWLTLFHWDYPQELFLQGGWQNPDSADWFAEYTGVVVNALSDRISNWMTYCEPSSFLEAGHKNGYFAPGLRLPPASYVRCCHHANLGHGKAVQVIRANAKTTPAVGLAPHGPAYFPETDSPEDLEAARKLTFSSTLEDSALNWWMDPLILGKYPEETLKVYGVDDSFIQDGDMELIAQPLDFFGINYYFSRCAKMGEEGPEVVPDPPGYPMTTQSDWRMEPNGLYHFLHFVYDRYQLPIVITENGHQSNDHVMLDGKVHDPQRIDYLDRHLSTLGKVIDEGIPVNGYFQWTFMDNFEWCMGYKIRVGMVHVDYQTQKRTPKDSAYWYKRIIETNGERLLANRSEQGESSCPV